MAQPEKKVVMAPPRRSLKKGDLLFKEGESSRSMYVIQNGMVRIYKRKGKDAEIELDTIRSGQIVGELAFLDGNPRSASGRALTDCELTEISGTTFTDTLKKMPTWLKLLLKTVVGRLRSASTRIRQLEQASTEYNYSQAKGTRTAQYIYLANTDVLKTCTALLLVASRNGIFQEDDPGIAIRVGLLQKYANQILKVPVAKITSVLDALKKGKVLNIDDTGASVKLMDDELLETFISYLNEQSLVEPEKQHNFSTRSFKVMGYLARNLDFYPADETGTSNLNIAEIIKSEADKAEGEAPFKTEDLGELISAKICSNLNIKSNDEVFAMVNYQDFLKLYRFQRIVKAIEAVNENHKG